MLDSCFSNFTVEQKAAVCTMCPPQVWQGIIPTSLVITSCGLEQFRKVGVHVFSVSNDYDEDLVFFFVDFVDGAVVSRVCAPIVGGMQRFPRLPRVHCNVAKCLL